MFYAGFSRLDVTPPLGAPLAGYAKHRPASTVLDPLELNAVAFSDGENKAVLITADFLYVMENAATKIRDMIAQRCEIPADHVFMQGLHQHTSIRVGTKPHLGNMGYGDEEYLSVLYRKYCDVAQMALADLQEATLETAEQETPEPLSFIRRYRMADGTVRTNPGRGNPDVVGPIGQSDNTVRLLRLKRKDGPEIAIVNFSTHPDVIGGTRISADWPGFVRRYTEAGLPGVKCVLVNGAQGDSNHIDLADVEKKKVGYKHSAYMGRVIVDTVLEIWNKTQPRQTGKILGFVEMKLIPTNTRGMERVEECLELRQRINAGLAEAPKEMGKLGEFHRICNLPRETLYQKVPVSVLGLGDVAFVGFGGEPFTQYATAAREAGKELYVITACLTNGGQGYLPTTEAFEEGGYEAASSSFSETVAPVLQNCAAELLNRYRESRLF